MADQRAIDWLLSGDTGRSSKCICCVLTGSPTVADNGFCAFPMDASDFGRCYRLLQRIPEWRARLPEVAALFPQWGPLVAAWDEVSLMYEAYIAVDERDREARRAAYAPVGSRLYQLEQEGFAADGWINTSPGCWNKLSEDKVRGTVHG